MLPHSAMFALLQSKQLASDLGQTYSTSSIVCQSKPKSCRWPHQGTFVSLSSIVTNVKSETNSCCRSGLSQEHRSATRRAAGARRLWNASPRATSYLWSSKFKKLVLWRLQHNHELGVVVLLTKEPL